MSDRATRGGDGAGPGGVGCAGGMAGGTKARRATARECLRLAVSRDVWPRLAGVRKTGAGVCRTRAPCCAALSATAWPGAGAAETGAVAGAPRRVTRRAGPHRARRAAHRRRAARRAQLSLPNPPGRRNTAQAPTAPNMLRVRAGSAPVFRAPGARRHMSAITHFLGTNRPGPRADRGGTAVVRQTELRHARALRRARAASCGARVRQHTPACVLRCVSRVCRVEAVCRRSRHGASAPLLRCDGVALQPCSGVFPVCEARGQPYPSLTPGPGYVRDRHAVRAILARLTNAC